MFFSCYYSAFKSVINMRINPLFITALRNICAHHIPGLDYVNDPHTPWLFAESFARDAGGAMADRATFFDGDLNQHLYNYILAIHGTAAGDIPANIDMFNPNAIDMINASEFTINIKDFIPLYPYQDHAGTQMHETDIFNIPNMAAPGAPPDPGDWTNKDDIYCNSLAYMYRFYKLLLHVEGIDASRWSRFMFQFAGVLKILSIFYCNDITIHNTGAEITISNRVSSYETKIHEVKEKYIKVLGV